MKKCVVVLGMHRSGTFAMAGLLKILGVDFGKNLFYNGEVNEKGYFEHVGLVKINNAILDYLGTSQDNIAELPSGWEKGEKIIKFKEQIKDILQKEFGKSRLFGIKEPSICLLVALYKEIFEELKIEPIFIILKKSVEVTKSLESRDNFSLRKSIFRYERYNDIIEKYTKGDNKIFVEAEEIIDNTEEVMMNINKELKMMRLIHFRLN